ncbi:MAG: DUF3160 domain-containing protein [Deltaproteobacteria bacterium]
MTNARWFLAASALLCFACEAPNTRLPVDPGTPVTPKDPPGVEQERQRLLAELEATRDLSPQDFGAKYGLDFESLSPMTPTGIDHYPLIQASSLALDSNEESRLTQDGFVITDRRSFPSFLYGYQTIYMEDLPVYVSADSILHALHSSYDEILKTIEVLSLIGELDAMLGAMRANLQAGSANALGAQAVEDVDFYLAVAASLLNDQVVGPVASADPALVQQFFDGAKSANGWEQRAMFGVPRDFDFSQFKPRGHYTDSPDLERYFRAMMWLGRIDLRMIETQPDHSQRFHRRQVEGAFALLATMDQTAIDAWGRIDGTVEAFVGESDNMRVPELKKLLEDLRVQDLSDLSTVADDDIVAAITAGGYGQQRISSHIMINGLGEGTMPLSSTFMLLGQRYVVDSHVFSNVVYDRVQGGNVRRMMPNPLDAAFAALGNDQAGLYLDAELQQFSYAPDLHAMRFLTDAHGDAFWNGNLYNRWLTALRALSPNAETQDPGANGLPQIVATEAWGRRILNTQLASWAELRHDTILYAKQSYTGGASCEYPDAYVDPYPELYAALVAFAQHGRQIVMNLDTTASLASIVTYFDELEDVASTLQEMAEHQRTGTALKEEHLAFINDAVVVDAGCGDPVNAHGWFARLYFDRAAGARFDPTIADVHTQPTDEVGNPVGRVLHVGTGGPRLMVTTIETCTGQRAYVGLTSSYYEHITENFERLDDEDWTGVVQRTPPADAPWLAPIIVR